MDDLIQTVFDYRHATVEGFAAALLASVIVCLLVFRKNMTLFRTLACSLVVCAVSVTSVVAYLSTFDGTFETACARAMEEVRTGKVKRLSESAMKGVVRHCGEETLAAAAAAPGSVFAFTDRYRHRPRHWN